MSGTLRNGHLPPPLAPRLPRRPTWRRRLGPLTRLRLRSRRGADCRPVGHRRRARPLLLAPARVRRSGFTYRMRGCRYALMPDGRPTRPVDGNGGDGPSRPRHVGHRADHVRQRVDGRCRLLPRGLVLRLRTRRRQSRGARRAQRPPWRASRLRPAEVPLPRDPRRRTRDAGGPRRRVPLLRGPDLLGRTSRQRPPPRRPWWPRTGWPG